MYLVLFVGSFLYQMRQTSIYLANNQINLLLTLWCIAFCQYLGLIFIYLFPICRNFLDFWLIFGFFRFISCCAFYQFYFNTVKIRLECKQQQNCKLRYLMLRFLVEFASKQRLFTSYKLSYFFTVSCLKYSHLNPCKMQSRIFRFAVNLAKQLLLRISTNTI